MRIDQIKTFEQFNELADNWYNRTNNLRDYFTNEENPLPNRIHAKFLWDIMLQRMLKISEIYTSAITHREVKFEKGTPNQ